VLISAFIFQAFSDEAQSAMALDQDTVKKLAHLARLDLPDAELAPLVGELSRIMAFVEQLSAVDTSGVAPMTSVAHMTLPRRPDVVTDGNYPEKVLANAPDAMDGFFLVPKVVE
jgi:aspartyl-tRNA(Asn)/glutamyl-tRNA(Gln) amidotransferase subunit C